MLRLERLTPTLYRMHCKKILSVSYPAFWKLSSQILFSSMD